MEQISVIEHTNAELREHWGNLASNFLVGKTIRRVRYLNDRETEDIGWTKSGLVIEFTDGHWIVAMSDDEGNEAGSVWTSSQSEINVIPTI
jgi:hypothetical protein